MCLCLPEASVCAALEVQTGFHLFYVIVGKRVVVRLQIISLAVDARHIGPEHDFVPQSEIHPCIRKSGAERASAEPEIACNYPSVNEFRLRGKEGNAVLCVVHHGFAIMFQTYHPEVHLAALHIVGAYPVYVDCCVGAAKPPESCGFKPAVAAVVADADSRNLLQHFCGIE